jgi:hypothetical protein
MSRITQLSQSMTIVAPGGVVWTGARCPRCLAGG